MFDPIDDLAQRWQENPSAAMTVALCEALREHPRKTLVEQVGEFAQERHASDVSVLISVARMYIDSRRFGDAQTVLVAAGRQAPRDGKVYRWLGEVLLRRGDAERAHRVLERAVQLAANDLDAAGWLERAGALRVMQATAGHRAVAEEVARATTPTDPVPRPVVRFAPIIEEEEEAAPTEVFERVDTHEIEVATDPRAMAPVLTSPVPVAAPVARRDEPGFASLPTEQHAPSAVGHLPAMRNGAAPRPAHRPSSALRVEPPVKRELPPALPHPRDVLDALALAGVFETQTGATLAAWDRAARGPKRKGAPTLIAGMALFLAGSVGVYYAYRQKRGQDHLRAEAILTTVEATLRAAKPDRLPEAEKQLAQAFQLESRSPRAALDWTRERALVGLVKSGGDIAFEDAMTRAKEVGVPAEQFAFARVASFLFQGDTAGAAGMLPRWEGAAAGDPWFQLVAGATLERAGDPRARDRYAAAARLDPELSAAKVGLARAAAMDGDLSESTRIATELRAAMPDRAEPVALVALAWGRDPRREDLPVPPEVDEVLRREAELPPALRFVPHAVAALTALDELDAPLRTATPGTTRADPRIEIRSGLSVAESPAAAVWLGAISLALGDEALSRKAALAALQFSAAYEPARALAARVALLGGRIDEALKATEDLDPTAPDVAVVRAASAYERLDPDGVARALEALPAAARKLSFLAPLDLATDALSGKLRLDAAKVLAMAADDAPWGELIAMDTALSAGDITSADKVAARWTQEVARDPESQPLRALRLARLARYEGRLDAADALSETALAHGTVTARVLCERAYVLVARGRAADIPAMLARYPLVLGPLATWLSAYAAASGGAVEAARGKVASLDPPPVYAPLEARVAAAAALGAMKDRRRGADYVREVLASGSLHPDLVAAAVALGFRKVEHRRRPPTYGL